MTDKKAVALAIYESSEKSSILSVLRPEDDEDHPGVWGMPATSLNDGESWEEAVRRAAREKLNVEIESIELLSEGKQSRDDYDITLRNYQAEIKGNQTPDVQEASTTGTKYEEWDWKPVNQMKEAATETASLCTTLILDLHEKEFDRPENIERVKHYA